jgi:molybdopterin converting factor small subunit
MSVEVHLPPSLQPLVRGRYFKEIEGNTVGDCLDGLVQEFPQLKEHLFDKNKKLRQGFTIFINGVSAYPEMLKKTVGDGDKLYIINVMVGG